MLKKASFGFALFCLASSALAQWEISAGYSSFDWDQTNHHMDVGAVVFGAGYQFPLNDRLTLVPAIRVCVGVTDKKIPLYIGSSQNGVPEQTVVSAKSEINEYYGVQLRAQFHLENSFYLFAMPSYSSIEYKISTDDLVLGRKVPSIYFDEKGFGISVGAGKKFGDSVSAEISYEKAKFGNWGKTDILNAQLRYGF